MCLLYSSNTCNLALMHPLQALTPCHSASTLRNLGALLQQAWL